MGQQGLEEMNDFSRIFADVCVTSNLVIGFIIFHPKRIHNATWVSTDLSTENLISTCAL
ncbi:hypothetical protein DPMN_171900 [Dreissena polymorpha]|uniref:Uncharacterized protein n=1 Tax=Dreissena polymorpha TaxID=45954 RepID=A0A9D4DZS3_DREPO|nr:hypothetical protein DPMN_171900 [Dreissena polymorpha]